MKIMEKELSGTFDISTPPAYTDKRGTLVRLYHSELFEKAGIGKPEWKQQTFQHSRPNHILRGLHVQRSPFTEAKLINIISGKVFWVFIDVRKDSPSFGQWDSTILSPEDINGLYVARGFAHGCLSLTEDTMLVINADNFYSQEYGIGIAYDDPELGIKWAISGFEPIISDEHRAYPSFKEFKEKFGGV